MFVESSEVFQQHDGVAHKALITVVLIHTEKSPVRTQGSDTNFSAMSAFFFQRIKVHRARV